MRNLWPQALLIAWLASISASAQQPQQRGGRRDRQMPPEREQELLQREPITFELDVPYADDKNSAHHLDIFLPKSPKSDKLPVIFFVHGGGWKSGDKSEAIRHVMPLMRTGQYACVSIN